MGDSDKLLFGEVDLDFNDVEPGSGQILRPPASGHHEIGETTRMVPAAMRAEAPTPVPGLNSDDEIGESTRVGSVDPKVLEQLRRGDAAKTKKPEEATAFVGAALSANDAPPSSRGIADPRIQALRDLYAKGDADGALCIAGAMQSQVELEVSPEIEIDMDDDDAEHTAISDSGVQLASALRGAPKLLMTPTQISALPLDPRAGFLLMHIDGFARVDEIVDACAMPQSETITILRQLLALRVIAFEG
jgi:hypothetical protein